MPRKLTIGKTSKISIFQRKTGRWIVNWYDEHGAKRKPSAYTDKLNADVLLVKSHFGVDRPIDRIRSDEIEDFLDSKKAAGRRRNNLRSEIITLFRYAQNRLRALPRDRKTEAELVDKVKAKGKSIETFSPCVALLARGGTNVLWTLPGNQLK
jgi:hypothetical protein